MVLGSIIAAGSSLLGGILQNNSAKAQAQNQMDFQREMSDTAHQREVKDLEAAGLNPILSARGSGASTPSGASAPVENVLKDVVSSAQAYRRQNAELENIEQTNDLIKAQQYQAQTQGVLNDTNAAKANTETLALMADRIPLDWLRKYETILNKGKFDAADSLAKLGLPSEAFGAASAAAPVLGKMFGAGAAGYVGGKAFQAAKNVQYNKNLGMLKNSAKSLPASSFKGALLPPPSK